MRLVVELTLLAGAVGENPHLGFVKHWPDLVQARPTAFSTASRETASHWKICYLLCYKNLVLEEAAPNKANQATMGYQYEQCKS